jgi:hypothetical protein
MRGMRNLLRWRSSKW